MAITKSGEQVLDQQVEDWEASSKPQSFTVPAGTYLTDFDHADLSVGKEGPNGEQRVFGQLQFISKSPLEGRQLRVSRMLTSTNQKGEHYGIGQFLDEVDILLANAGEKSVNRAKFKSGKDLRALCDRLNELQPTDVPVVADQPGKSAAGKTFQNLHVGLRGADNGQAVSGPKIPNVGDKIEYDGKTWTVDEVDDVGVTLKLGKKEKILSFEELNSSSS